MLIGAGCFRDSQITSMIVSHDEHGTCNITRRSNEFVYDTKQDDYLEQYFDEVFDVFTPESQLPITYPDSKKKSLADFLCEWGIFSSFLSNSQLQTIITEIGGQRYAENKKLFEEPVGIVELLDTDYINEYCLLKTYTWEDFCNYVRSVNRYYSNHINKEKLKLFFQNFKQDFRKGELSLHRARVGNSEGFKAEGMAAPPPERLSVGRANSRGIQCLYLTNNVITSLHEIRARELDYVTIADFELNRDISLVDLSYMDDIGPFSCVNFDCTWYAVNIGIIRKIASEISKPLSRLDNELEYIPTQYICDFIKHLQYDGIKYKSTLSGDGMNYAIFDQKKFKCRGVHVCHVNSLEYHYDIIT